MTTIFNDLKSEILRFTKGKTLDAILPTIIFLATSRYFPMKWAASLTLLFSFLMVIKKGIKKEPLVYAMAGFIGVLLAIALSLVSGSSKGYFIPSIVSSILLAISCLVSLSLRRPLAAWMSHLTRNWPVSWFWRDDIRPAYTEVTILWAAVLIIRVIGLIIIYKYTTTETVFMANLFLGGPSTLVILSLSYIYGILRLRSLHGPSVEEFINKTKGPWIGQRSGF